MAMSSGNGTSHSTSGSWIPTFIRAVRAFICCTVDRIATTTTVSEMPPTEELIALGG